MSNLSNINEKLPAAGPKHKRARKSPRLQKGQVDNILTESQPDPTETLDVGPPTSIAHNGVLFGENHQSSKQLGELESDKS